MLRTSFLIAVLIGLYCGLKLDTSLGGLALSTLLSFALGGLGSRLSWSMAIVRAKKALRHGG